MSGELDHPTLHGTLIRIRDLGLKLISVKRVGEDEGFQSEDHNR